MKKRKILNEQNLICIAPPFKIDGNGKILDPETNPGAYGIGRNDEIIFGSGGEYLVRSSRGAAQVAKGQKAEPLGLFVLNDDQIYILMKFPDGKVVPYYKSSGRSGYDVMQGRFVPAGQVELWGRKIKDPETGIEKFEASTRLKKAHGHPDIASRGEILADGKPNPIDGKYIAADSELGAAGKKLDDGLGDEMMAKATAEIDQFGPAAWLEGGANLSNVNKYEHMGEYGKALNSKLEELGYPKFEDGIAFKNKHISTYYEYLTDASLNHYLIKFNATNSKFMDGRGHITGISPQAGPTIKQMQEADKLLKPPAKAAAKAVPKAAPEATPKAVKKKGWFQKARDLIGLEEDQKRLNSLEKIIEEELEQVLRDFK